MIALKGVHARRGLPLNSRVQCVDNSGAKVVSIIGVLNKNCTRKRLRTAVIGDFVVVAVKVGSPEVKGKMFKAIVVKTVASYFRVFEGIRVSFESNGVVILTDDLLCKVTSIKGVIAKEAFAKVNSLSGKGATIL